jgi:hypothetical protein
MWKADRPFRSTDRYGSFPEPENFTGPILTIVKQDEPRRQRPDRGSEGLLREDVEDGRRIGTLRLRPRLNERSRCRPRPDTFRRLENRPPIVVRP